MAAELEAGAWPATLTWIESLLGELPWPIKLAVGVLALIAFTLSVLAVITLAMVKIKQGWADHLRPRAYSPEQRQKALLRRQFAEYLTDEIRKKNRTENWRDQRYTELEAEVEAEGEYVRLFTLFSRPDAPRREESLSIALSNSRERLILVEGDPGSGKSVALRHVALELGLRAAASRRLDSKLPVYVNLKELKREEHSAIDRDLIRNHVVRTLRRINDRFVDEFVEEEFDSGLRSGSWVFLFDSFDELPDVLGATEVDQITTAYTQAISNFLGGINRCRGIVASRYYRGPKNIGWSSFRILPLSGERQRTLIRKSLLSKPTKIRQLETDLALAGDDMRNLAQNPMLLGLLCEHVRSESTFPKNSYELMSTYVAHRMLRDAERIKLRYSLESTIVVKIAEEAAFAMTDDPSMGLSPGFPQLEAAVVQLGMRGPELIRRALNALVYMRLARSEGEEEDEFREFSFSHRRFQEYFATKVLLGGGRTVSPQKLLQDARWREAAVVVLQMGGPSMVEPLLREAQRLVARAADKLGGGITRPRKPIGASSVISRWQWPEKILHTLSILQAGTTYDSTLLNDSLRGMIGEIIDAAMSRGDLLDAKLALQIAGPAPEEDLVKAMRLALNANSRWLDDAVYWQASRLSRPDPRIAQAIRNSVKRLAMSGNLAATFAATRAYISRLPQASELLKSVVLGYWAPRLDAAVLVIISATCVAIFQTPLPLALGAVVIYSIDVYLARRYNDRMSTAEVPLGRRFIAAALLFCASLSLDWDPLFTSLRTSDLASLGIIVRDFARTDLIVAVENKAALGLLLFWWLFWMPAVMWCISQGVFLKATLWVFAPIGPFILAGQFFIKNVRWPKFLAKDLAIITSIIVASGALAGGIVFLVIRIPLIATVIGSVTGAGLFFLAIIRIVGYVSYLFRVHADNRAVEDIPDGEIGSPLAFAQTLGKVRTRRGRTFLLRRTLKANVSAQGVEWARLIREIMYNDERLHRLSSLAPSIRPPSPPAKPFVHHHRMKQLVTALGRVDEGSHIRKERDLFFLLLERACQSAN